MSMRQLYESDPVHTHVTDSVGNRQGILIARYEQWCWVEWEGSSIPVTEHADDLWICQQEPLEKVGAFLRKLWQPNTEIAAG